MPVNRQRPKKIWTGRKRKAFKHIWKRRVPILNWAISINPGDWIATCEGTNRQVKNIEYHWITLGQRTSVLFEVVFTDAHDTIHYCPGGGCALPRESIEAIEAYYKNWIKAAEDNSFAWDDGSFKNQLELMKERFEAGKSIVDENGELLPEFDHKHRKY